jgi:DNA-binding CsgD family transcriptional regulator
VRTRFDSPAWHAAIAELVRSGDAQSTASALIDAIGLAVSHGGTCLLAFHKNAPPEVLHHTLDPAGAKHYLDRYLAGPYLLDPLYQLAMRADKPDICRFRDQTPDRFRSSEYYRQYCDRTHLRDEMDFLLDVNDETTLVLVVGRREKMFSKVELDRLKLIEATVRAAMHNIWDRSSGDKSKDERDDGLHRRLTRCFETFGESNLTGREQQITQLLLRGYSTKAIAQELGIAPGTVMVHKRNLFLKLDITSQYELFSMFIENLSRS